mmetsp:Transcript_14384/g.24751  ORF Transcript_14384/g.24751 Transcript_14384/m.24751 type:complete len:207 (+) Transcript_14384:570-1190(+)
MDLFCRELLLLLHKIISTLLELEAELEPIPTEFRLVIPAIIAFVFLFGDRAYDGHARSSLFQPRSSLDSMIIFPYKKLGAEETNASEQFERYGEIAWVKHRLRKFNMTKVPHTVCFITATGIAGEITSNGPHALIHQTFRLGYPPFEGRLVFDLYYGHSSELIRSQNTKLHILHLFQLRRAVHVTLIIDRHFPRFSIYKELKLLPD